MKGTTTVIFCIFCHLAVMAQTAEPETRPQVQLTVTLSAEEWGYIIRTMENTPTVSAVWTPIKNRIFAQLAAKQPAEKPKEEQPKKE